MLRVANKVHLATSNNNHKYRATGNVIVIESYVEFY